MWWDLKIYYCRVLSKMLWLGNKRFYFKFSWASLSQKSTEQNVKDVINASSIAISKDKDLHLDENYLQQVAEPGHNLRENIESIQLSRGDADKQALLQKYILLEKPSKKTGISELDFLLKDFEAIRSEILGSRDFLGVKQNLRNLFLKNLSQQTI